MQSDEPEVPVKRSIWVLWPLAAVVLLSIVNILPKLGYKKDVELKTSAGDAAVKETEQQITEDIKAIYKVHQPRMLTGLQTPQQNGDFIAGLAAAKKKLVTGCGYTDAQADELVAKLAREEMDRQMPGHNFAGGQAIAPKPQAERGAFGVVEIPYNVIFECLKKLDSNINGFDSKQKANEILDKIVQDLDAQGIEAKIIRDKSPTRFAYRMKGSTEAFTEVFLQNMYGRGR